MKHIRLFKLLGISLIVVSIGLGYFAVRVRAQDDIISELTKRLTEQSIPLKSIEIQSQLPFSLKITLQRNDEQNKPLEPFYVHTVKREVTLAHERGFGVNDLTLIILNTKGEVEYWVNEPIKEISLRNVPSAIENDQVANLIRENLSLFDLKLNKLEVSSDFYGNQKVTMQLQVEDIETANRILPEFMPSLREFFDGLNKSSSTKIGVYRLDLVTEKDQPILHYVSDLQLDQENWWMAEGVTMDWFPHPLPPLEENVENSAP